MLHHYGHFFCVHTLTIVILLLVEHFNGCLLFSSESFPSCFCRLSFPCWCWHSYSPWCSQHLFSPCYCCHSSKQLFLAIVVAHLVLAIFATHILLSIVADLVTRLLFPTLGDLLSDHY